MDFFMIHLGGTTHSWKTLFSEESFAFSLLFLQGVWGAEASPHGQDGEEGNTRGLSPGVGRLCRGGHLGIGL